MEPSAAQLEQHLYRDPYHDPAARPFEGFCLSRDRRLRRPAYRRGLDTTLTLHTGQNEDSPGLERAAIEEVRALDASAAAARGIAPATHPTDLGGRTGRPGSSTRSRSPLQPTSRPTSRSGRARALRKTTRTRRRWFDTHGNLTEEDDDGCRLGAARDPEAATIRFSYAEDEGLPWILGRPAEREVFCIGAGQRLSDERHYYDGPALEGLPTGQLDVG